MNIIPKFYSCSFKKKIIVTKAKIQCGIINNNLNDFYNLRVLSMSINTTILIETFRATTIKTTARYSLIAISLLMMVILTGCQSLQLGASPIPVIAYNSQN